MVELSERSRRVPLSLSVEASGKDAGGHSFDESTRTVNISGGGICFESQRHLGGGDARLSNDRSFIASNRHIPDPPVHGMVEQGRAHYEGSIIARRSVQREIDQPHDSADVVQDLEVQPGLVLPSGWVIDRRWAKSSRNIDRGAALASNSGP
jgi:hypothetical protein